MLQPEAQQRKLLEGQKPKPLEGQKSKPSEEPLPDLENYTVHQVIKAAEKLTLPPHIVNKLKDEKIDGKGLIRLNPADWIQSYGDISYYRNLCKSMKGSVDSSEEISPSMSVPHNVYKTSLVGQVEEQDIKKNSQNIKTKVQQKTSEKQTELTFWFSNFN